ncbi:MAG: zinc ribbon domain-containing protein [Ruminiclostridium sp.]|nr:zinc ribbon domain-containing protein [Ruminiclostridium sp.]
MDIMNWMIQTSTAGSLPIVMSEYLLNDMGIFARRERRMPKKAPLTAITGFRIGYVAVPGTDYRMAPMDRNAILWYKITSVTEDSAGLITVRGNTKDVITISCTPDNRDAVLQFISAKRKQHPTIVKADYAAASWICWRDDDDWGDASTLMDMVNAELDTERFIDPDVLEETEITVVPENSIPLTQPTSASRPKFCRKCGELLPLDGSFCENCGNNIL